MKKFLAIGHWTENKNATLTVAMAAQNIKDFREQLKGNAFVPYVVITENKLKELETVSEENLYEWVKKLTTNYRKWDHICDYIDQCYDIMKEKLENVVL